MKARQLLFVMAICMSAVSWAQPEPLDTLWSRRYGSELNEEFFATCTTLNGGFLFAGRAGTGSNTDVYLVRTDGAGDTLWTRKFGGDNADEAHAAQTVGNDGFVIAGTTLSNGSFPGDVYVLRVSDAGNLLWSQSVGNGSAQFTPSEEASSILVLSDGGFIVAGSAFRGATNYDGFLVRLNSAGDTLWTRTYGLNGSDRFSAISPTSDGGFVMAGLTNSMGPGSTSFYLVRVDANGEQIWSQAYGTAAQDGANGVYQTTDGGFIVGGFTITAGLGDDYYLVKTNAEGVAQWSRSYPGSGWDRAYTIKPSRDNGYILGGTSNSFGGANQMYLLKTDSDGDTTWRLPLGGPSDDYMYAMEPTRDGGLICVGASALLVGGQLDGYVYRLAGYSGVGGVVRDLLTNDPVPGVQVSAVGQASRVTTDSQGQFVLTLQPDQSYDIHAFGQCVARDTVFGVFVLQDSIHIVNLVVGDPNGVISQTSMNIVAPNHGVGAESLLVQNTGSGEIEFRVYTFGTEPAGDWMRAVPETGTVPPFDSRFVAIEVHADTTDFGVFDYFGYLTVHMNSCPDSVVRVNITAAIYNDLEDFGAGLPQDYSLTVYPNPFNPSTSIEFALPHDGLISLRVFDVNGREVSTLVDGHYSAGTHRIAFDGNHLSTGIYFARIETGDEMLVTKLLLLK